MFATSDHREYILDIFFWKQFSEVEQDIEGSYQIQCNLQSKGKGIKLHPRYKVGDLVRLLLPSESSDIQRAAKRVYFGKELYKIRNIVPSNTHPGYMDSYQIFSQGRSEMMKGLYLASSL